MTVTKKSQTKCKDTTTVSYTVKSFGEKLIELRNERGITQAESAKLIGVTRNSLSMYERSERCPNIDIAVNAANAYDVSLDYLFGTGYRNKKNNEYSMYDMGFSEEALDFLCIEENRYYVDAILSDSRIKKISDILYGSDYKPLINSYEMNYMSRLISDLLYCIRQLESKEYLLRTDYDEYVDCCDTIQTELERIKSLLEDAPDTNYHQAFQDGFNAAVKKFCAGELQIATLDKSKEKL